jgi:Raf kinase inhibitor-like YbhB/YbcL family protein
VKLTISLVLACACGHQDSAAAPSIDISNLPKLAVTSPAFVEGAAIPTEYTCEGSDASPALAWTGAPPVTKSFALIVDDPDAPDPKAPKRVWVHWVRSRIPATTTSLADSRTGSANPGADGKNDWGTPGWRGPCPPIGRHRYVFSVYALDADLGAADMTKAELVKTIAGHVVAAGQLVGTYQKK